MFLLTFLWWLCALFIIVKYLEFWYLLYLKTIKILFSHDSTTSLCNTLNTELAKLSAWFDLGRSSPNNLGSTILDLKDHIAYICSNLSKFTAVIHKTSHVLDTKTLTLLYNTIISPYLNYCVTVRGNTYKTIFYPCLLNKRKLFALFAILCIWITLLDCFTN